MGTCETEIRLLEKAKKRYRKPKQAMHNFQDNLSLRLSFHSL